MNYQRDYRSDLRDIALDVRTVATLFGGEEMDIDTVLGDLARAIEQLTEIEAELAEKE